MEKIVVANLKMNFNIDELNNYLNNIKDIINTKRMVICPSALYLPYFLGKKCEVGIQDISNKNIGSYTGEISASQVSSMGISYALVGHSERRLNYNETDSIINEKINQGLINDLKVILCIGETKEEKNLLKTDRVLKRQLVNGLRGVSPENIRNVIIAYEPIWSIGTGRVLNNKDLETTIIYIKGIVNNMYHEDIDIPVLYGGSVNDKNISEINKIDALSGVLVGGSSLDPVKLKKIKEFVIS